MVCSTGTVMRISPNLELSRVRFVALEEVRHTSTEPALFLAAQLNSLEGCMLHATFISIFACKSATEWAFTDLASQISRA